MTRQEWKVFYRKLRVARRETAKATADAIIYGTGAVSVSKDGESKHVPFPDYLNFLKIGD